ncbi:MAG: cupin domain-containing protein [Deltaproteobacteria bacterium]|jgi:uncharacterized cupin superfamily protein|nr:cupin domain-containing protein [Deltaproteobacteria bacterium]
MDAKDKRHENLINVSEAPSMEIEKGRRFGATVRQLAGATGGKLVGCNWFEVPPGRAAFPRHWHAAMEEVIFILEGEGALRIGEREVTVGVGDYVTLPPGPDHAHQLRNSTDGPLRYLCLSNKVQADVVGYPDSNKFAASGSPSSNYFDTPWVRALFRTESAIDYYDGEEID